MLDHIGFGVSDFQRSSAFYEKALAPLGYRLMKEFSAGTHAAFGRTAPGFWIGVGKPLEGPIHVAFAAENRAAVRAFHEAALAAGGIDNGAPGIRAHYHPNYYGAFVLDPDGHNVEAVCHKPE